MSVIERLRIIRSRSSRCLWICFGGARDAAGVDRSGFGCDRRPAPWGSGGRFFHGYYDGYCYLPLYVFCGKHLLAAKLRRSNIDGSAGAVEEMDRVVGQIRKRWPKVRITLRADSGFAREELMAWCESNAVDYVFGLAKNARLIEVLEPALARAQARQARSGKAEQEFTDSVIRRARVGVVSAAWWARQNSYRV